MTMITGHMTSQLDGDARIWTLTVPQQPASGELVEWEEGDLTYRGWISGQESSRPGTVLVSVASRRDSLGRVEVYNDLRWTVFCLL